jgi:hypothetical protein
MTDKKKEYITAYKTLMEQERAIADQKEKLRSLARKIDVKGIERLVFEDDVKTLFDQHPDLTSFRWRQYTTYFNDGDPTYFNAYMEDWQINDSPSEYDEEDEEGDETSGQILQDVESITKLEAVVDDFMAEYTEDDLERMFGDHAIIIVRRDGITVEEYTEHS